jgi:hypothetical protein
MNRQEFPHNKERNLKEIIHKTEMNLQERLPNKELNPGEIIVLQEIQIQLTILMLQETVTKELNIPIICFKTRFIWPCFFIFLFFYLKSIDVYKMSKFEKFFKKFR